jgi:hypothetical protein
MGQRLVTVVSLMLLNRFAVFVDIVLSTAPPKLRIFDALSAICHLLGGGQQR